MPNKQGRNKKSRVCASFLSPVRNLYPYADVVPLDKKGREIPSSVRVAVNLEYYSVEDAVRIALSL